MQFIQFYKNLTQKKKFVRKGADKLMRAKSNLQKSRERSVNTTDNYV